MDTDPLTRTLAIWGAVTGTIGTLTGIANLILRFDQHKKDQPKLVCSSEFSFDHESGHVRPRHKVILRSVGKTPVTVDFVRYYINPRDFWQKIFKRKAWKLGRFVCEDTLTAPLHIAEGKKETISIKLPSGLSIREIVKAEVHDQTGAIWPIAWPSRAKLEVLAHHEQLYESELSNENRVCKIIGYIASGTYYIYTHWNPKRRAKSAFSGRVFHFKTEKDYQEKLKDIIENQQPKILSCETDEIK